jgi:biopolymer transport protein ExbD
MKRYSQRSGHTAMAELNVTPLLDLAFVLLIIFIITTPLLESNVTLALPTASEHPTPPLDPKSIRTINVTRDGQIYLNDQPVDRATLQQDLIAFKAEEPDAAVVIRADKTLPYQKVMDIFDAVQTAKIEKMSPGYVAP